jgi:hypothetical protein
MKCIIYFIQPAELIGTDRYKIGCSGDPNLDRCNNVYTKGSRYICIMECNNPFELKRKIKNNFLVNFKLLCGYDFFSGNENHILNEFIEITRLHQHSIDSLNDHEF